MKAKVFNKGQVVIPVALRRKLGIEIGSNVDLVEENGAIKIVPVKKKVKATDLAGIFSKYAQGKNVLTRKEINEVTEKEMTKKYAKHSGKGTKNK